MLRTRPLVRQLLGAVLAVLTIVATASLIRPVFLQRQAPVAQRILEHKYVDSLALRAPWLRAPAELAMQTEQFRLDRDAFAQDLIHTGKVAPVRARSLADVAVREAYKQRIPPALVLGVMLTENDEFKSRARSRVGAVGLMQVYGKHWRGALGRKFGTDLRDDATNLRYGIY
ncbi:MAG TPA: transglycosylase SLT domain-containing protein, partial [Gemmatimonadaceae bacterium]